MSHAEGAHLCDELGVGDDSKGETRFRLSRLRRFIPEQAEAADRATPASHFLASPESPDGLVAAIRAKRAVSHEAQEGGLDEGEALAACPDPEGGADDSVLEGGGGPAEHQDVAAIADGTYGLPAVLTPDEVAAFLRVDRKTVYRALRDGQLPGLKVGTRYVILRDALVAALRGKIR